LDGAKKNAALRAKAVRGRKSVTTGKADVVSESARPIPD
jgi:hypothetical protein